MKTNANITAALAAGALDPYLRVEIEWTPTNWTNESAYAISALGHSEIMDPFAGLLSLGTAHMATATVVMNNPTKRYSAKVSGTQAATYGIRGLGIRISAGYTVSGVDYYERVFTGRIMDCKAPETEETAELSCQDLASDPKRQNYTSAMYEDEETKTWLGRLRGWASVASHSFENTVHVIPFCYLDDDELLDEMRKVAASEAGCLFYDADGTLHYWGPHHWIGTTSGLTLDRSDFVELTPQLGYDNVYNIIAVTYEPQQKGRATTVYSLKRPVMVPRNGTAELTINFTKPLAEFVSYDLAASDGGGNDMTADVTALPVLPDGAQRWTVTFTNADTVRAAWVTRFDVVGYPVDKRQAETYIEDASGVGEVDRRYDLPTNPYIQTEQQARFLAKTLAQRLKTVRAVYVSSGQYGNPLIELGDIVTLEGDIAVTSATTIVVAIDWAFGDDYTMALTCADKSGLYAYTESQYWIIGTSACGARLVA